MSGYLGSAHGRAASMLRDVTAVRPSTLSRSARLGQDVAAWPCIPTSSAGLAERVDETAEEIVDFAADLIRIPTVNPPGEEYETCARFIGDRLRAFDFEVAVRGRRRPSGAHARRIRGST